MPDAKKLPVIYAVLDDHFDAGFAAMAFRNEHRAVKWSLGIHPVAALEPVVPRCKTCKCFAPLTAGDKALCSLESRLQPWFIPRDGSGYCHEHSENCSDHPEAKR